MAIIYKKKKKKRKKYIYHTIILTLTLRLSGEGGGVVGEALEHVGGGGRVVGHREAHGVEITHTPRRHLFPQPRPSVAEPYLHQQVRQGRREKMREGDDGEGIGGRGWGEEKKLQS